MRLSLISEFRYGKLLRQVQPLLQELPKSKQKHSHRVAKRLHKAGVGKAGVYAALLHDYLERGGDSHTLADHITNWRLPKSVLKAVRSLSQDEDYSGNDNQPLTHVQNVLSSIDDVGLRSIIILCKLSDRLDNLIKRQTMGRIGNNYRRKSIELIDYLVQSYEGESRPMRKLLKQISKIFSSN